MIDIEGLLGKVANNGASLSGILSHDDWNTLVQAVRELQSISKNNNKGETDGSNGTDDGQLVQAAQTAAQAAQSAQTAAQEAKNDAEAALEDTQEYIKTSGTERFYGFTKETPLLQSAVDTDGKVFFNTITKKFCYGVPINAVVQSMDDIQDAIPYKYYANWHNSNRYYCDANPDGKDKVYILDDTLYIFNNNDELVSIGHTQSELPENIDELIKEAVNEAIDESIKSSVTIKSGTERFYGIVDEDVAFQSYAGEGGSVVYNTKNKMFCLKVIEQFTPTPAGDDAETSTQPIDIGVAEPKAKYYSNWYLSYRYHSVSNSEGLDKVYICDSKLYVFNNDGDLVECNALLVTANS